MLTQKSEIIQVLNSLSKEELVRIIAQVAEQDEAFKNGLLVKYDKGDHSRQIQLTKKLIGSIVKKYVGREGFIPYRETNGFATEMLTLIEDNNDAQDDLLALEIVMVVMAEGVAAFQYADDSDGDIGMLVEEALERTHEMASSLNPEDVSTRERFFNRLLAMSKSEIFQDWEEYQITLLHICTEFADVEKCRAQLRAAIEHQMALNVNNKYRQYADEALLKILFELIQSHGNREDTERFVQKHLPFSFFREWAIERSMESRDYRLAIELAEAGEQQDRQLPGLISKWKAARYEAYKKLSLKQEQMLLAKELLLDGDYDYYLELESLFEGNKEELYRDILAELKEANNWSAQGVYLNLISDKNDLEEMMTYVRDNPSVIEEYAHRLSASYREEVERIYINHISNEASSSSNRKEYQQVCAMLKRYKEIAGQASQTEIILQLETDYNRRPAFLDELEKIK
ncbi:hypothetical protein EBB07_22950 [Paenibacillaceae bacterium]|nr:hypothetical protein EBB07_22950 [Paenibacillaceae bacterium]